MCKTVCAYYYKFHSFCYRLLVALGIDSPIVIPYKGSIGGRKHWGIWQIDGQSPKFSPSKLLAEYSLSWYYLRVACQSFLHQIIKIAEFANVFSHRCLPLYGNKDYSLIYINYTSYCELLDHLN